MTWRAAFPLLPLLGLAFGLAGCGDPAPPAAPAAPAAAGIPAAVGTPERGRDVRVVYGPAPGETFHTTGRLRHRHLVTGDVGSQRVPPDRDVEATVDLRSRTEGPVGGPLTTTVEGRLEVVERALWSPEAPRERVVPMTLRFDLDPAGGAVHRSIRLEAPEDLRPDLELLVAGFTERFRFPREPVRVGDVFEPQATMFLDDALVRPLYFLFLRRAQAGAPAGAPIEGRVAIEALERHGDLEVLRTRIAATHAFEANTDLPPATPEDVRIAYGASIEGLVRLVVEGGWARTAEWSRRRRISFRARDLDYVVETEATASLETVRVAR